MGAKGAEDLFGCCDTTKNGKKVMKAQIMYFIVYTFEIYARKFNNLESHLIYYTDHASN